MKFFAQYEETHVIIYCRENTLSHFVNSATLEIRISVDIQMKSLVRKDISVTRHFVMTDDTSQPRL